MTTGRAARWAGGWLFVGVVYVLVAAVALAGLALAVVMLLAFGGGE